MFPDHENGFLLVKIANHTMRSMLQEFILVGVPLKSEDAQDWLRKRAFDLTPTEVEAVSRISKAGLASIMTSCNSRGRASSKSFRLAIPAATVP